MATTISYILPRICLPLVLGTLAFFGRPTAFATDYPLPWEQERPQLNYSLLYCPLVKMSLSCGNERCQKLFGENEATCPQDCQSFLLQNWNQGVQCSEAEELYHPEDVNAVQAIVASASHQGKKVRVVGDRYSNTDIICSEDIIIATDRLNRIIGLETYNGDATVVVEAGASLFTVMQWLAQRDLALAGYPTPIIRPATIGGAIATSSHSSSPRKKASMSDIVASIDMVGWDGHIVTYAPHRSEPEHWQAATANLGLLGVMTKIRLRVRPEKALAMQAEIRGESELLNAHDPLDLLNGCDYGQIWWNPVAKTFLWVCGQPTDNPPDLTADNALTEVLNKTLKQLSTGFASPLSTVFELAACSRSVRCKFRDFVTPSSLSDPRIFSTLRNGKRVMTSAVTGQSFRMITTDFDGFNAIRTRFLELVVPARYRQDAIRAIYDYYHSSGACELFSIYNIRFVPITDQSLIANASPGGSFKAGEVAMFIEINGYYPKGMSDEHFARFDEYNTGLVRLLMEHYEARPHWGKGDHWYHSYADQLGHLAEGKDTFRKVLRQVDPHGMFQNSFTEDAGLGL
jgi:FAD/FMN-containing dehydrogenase